MENQRKEWSFKADQEIKARVTEEGWNANARMTYFQLRKRGERSRVALRPKIQWRVGGRNRHGRDRAKKVAGIQDGGCVIEGKAENIIWFAKKKERRRMRLSIFR